MIEIFNTKVMPWLYDNHYNLALAVCVILLGMALFYLVKPEGVAMGRKQQRVDHQKKVVMHKLVSAIEEEVLFDRMSRTEAREWYKKLGQCLDIVELVPLRARIMSRLASGVHTPVNLPGGGDLITPPWETEEEKKPKRRGNMMRS